MNLRKNIERELNRLVRELESEVVGKFYYDKAPKTAKSPYITFRVEDILDTSPSFNTTIRFMCWDERTKSSKDTIHNADVIRNKFNKGQFDLELLALHSVLVIEQNIPSENLSDKQCIELQFDTRIYVKEI